MGGTATLVPLDLRDADGIARLAIALDERFHKLDILIGNAGSFFKNPVVSEEQCRDIIGRDPHIVHYRRTYGGPLAAQHQRACYQHSKGYSLLGS